MFILQCILGLQSQSIDLKNDFAQADIPSGELVFIALTKIFKSDGVQDEVVLKFKINLYCEAEAARLWYEKLQFFVIARFLGEQGGSMPVHV